LDGTTECIIFEGAVNREMFDEYIKAVLIPSLHPGDIVIIDNLSAHKSPAAYAAIKSSLADLNLVGIHNLKVEML
jgi:transposase